MERLHLSNYRRQRQARFPDIAVLALVIVKQGVPGLANNVLLKWLGLKRATKIRKFFEGTLLGRSRAVQVRNSLISSLTSIA
jgi:hypothetical protein